MKNIIIGLCLLIPFIGFSQHTFSIVAVDPITGEIGSAGATCGDSIIWPGTPGALIISDIIPGVGAIHTQSYYNSTNQSNAHNRMMLGDTPQDIISWLVSNDIAADPSIRQYGIVDYNAGSPRSAAYTGKDCFNYKNHILGPNYAIQGNILLGQEILDAMESSFNNTDGCLADKLMGAMLGAKVIGADTRCTSEGTSSLSAFLRVAKPTDASDAIYIDLNIAGTAEGVEPLIELQIKYTNWKNANANNCSPISNNIELNEDNSKILVYPNPTNGFITIESPLCDISKIIIIDLMGRIVMTKEFPQYASGMLQIPLDRMKDGSYIISLFHDNEVTRRKITLQNM